MIPLSTRLRRVVRNPLIVKDGLSRMRSWWAPTIVFLYLGLLIGYMAIVASALMAGAGRIGGQSYALVWTQVFSQLVYGQFVLMCLVAPGVAAGAISGERERQTLDVLLVSGVSSLGIIWGKLAASMAFLVLLALSSMPLFATVFLFGGIDLHQFLVVQLLIFSTALTIGMLAIFLSTLFRRTLGATVSSYLLTFAGTVGTLVMGVILNTVYDYVGNRAGLVGPTTAHPAALAIHPLLLINPPFALAMAQAPESAVTNLGRSFQVLVLDNGPAVNFGPAFEPWQATVLVQIVMVACLFWGAVRLLRAPRRQRRIVAPLAVGGAVVPSPTVGTDPGLPALPHSES